MTNLSKSASPENEKHLAIRLANKVLDRISGDPDDDLAVLSRQLLRSLELKSASPSEPRTDLDDPATWRGIDDSGESAGSEQKKAVSVSETAHGYEVPPLNSELSSTIAQKGAGEAVRKFLKSVADFGANYKNHQAAEPRPAKMVGCEALRNGNEHFGIHDRNNFCEQRGCVAEARRDERDAKIVICDGCHFSYDYADTNSPYCSRCCLMLAHLQKLGWRYTLNRDQWESQLAGDLFCTCHNNHQGNKPYAYFWKSELAEAERRVLPVPPPNIIDIVEQYVLRGELEGLRGWIRAQRELASERASSPAVAPTQQVVCHKCGESFIFKRDGDRLLAFVRGHNCAAPAVAGRTQGDDKL